ncbi:unnamed protein product, partial [marine sediment metagenome]
MAEKRERDVGAGLVVGGIGGAALATVIATLLAAKPARAAPTDEKLDYLIEVLTTLVPVLAEVSEGQAELITAMQQWLAAQGIPVAPPAEGVEVTVRTAWVTKDPEQIFSSAIRSAGTYYSDKMVDFRNAKRILFKVESSLNEAVNIQITGNVQDSKELATDINGEQALLYSIGDTQVFIKLLLIWGERNPIAELMGYRGLDDPEREEALEISLSVS